MKELFVFSFNLKLFPQKIHTYFRGKFLDTLHLSMCGGHCGDGLPMYGLAQIFRHQVLDGHVEESSKVYILGCRWVDQVVEVPVNIQVLVEGGELAR